MNRYPALIDGKKGAYGVTFPDLPGIVAMGSTIEEAMRHAEEVLRDYAIEARKDGSGLRAAGCHRERRGSARPYARLGPANHAGRLKRAHELLAG